MAKKSNPDFLNGVPELLILQLLDRGPLHGYDLVRAIRTTSGERLDFGEGCIYPVLHRLEAQGLLSSRRETVDGRSRIRYRTTPRGRRRLATSRTAWSEIIAAVGLVLKGETDGRPALD